MTTNQQLQECHSINNLVFQNGLKTDEKYKYKGKKPPGFLSSIKDYKASGIHSHQLFMYVHQPRI